MKVKKVRLPLQSEYPKSINFGLAIYKVKFVKKLPHYGEVDPTAKKIRIRAGLAPRMLLTTFIHELIHVMEFEQPLKISHKMVTQLERAVLDMLIDNFL